MIKLRTLLLLIPFIAFFSCSEDEEIKAVTSKPVQAECLMASNIVQRDIEIHSPRLFQGGFKSIDVKYTSSYDYEGELLSSYTYSINQTNTDTLGDVFSNTDGYQFDFEYDNSLLTEVTSGDVSILTVKNVDDRIHTMTLYEEIDYIFNYDNNGNVIEILAEADGIDSVLSLKLQYEGVTLKKMEYYFGETKQIEHTYSYFNEIRNPYHGVIFYVIALIEAQGEFYNLDYSVFNDKLVSSIELGQLTGDGLWLSGIPGYEDTSEYSTNSKGYPTGTGSVTIQDPDGNFTIVESQTFGYTNCD